MAMVVNTNVSSLIAQSAANATNKSLDTAMERLATGKRINSAADDAAGMAITSRMSAQISGLDQAARNANDGISMIQTAESAYVEVSDMLQRMRQLAIQAASETYGDIDRQALDLEYQELNDEVNRIASTTEWNGFKMLDGTVGNGDPVKIQSGANAEQTVDIGFGTLYGRAHVSAENFISDSVKDVALSTTASGSFTSTIVASAATNAAATHTVAIGNYASLAENDYLIFTVTEYDGKTTHEVSIKLNATDVATLQGNGTTAIGGTTVIEDGKTLANIVGSGTNTAGAVDFGIASIAGTSTIGEIKFTTNSAGTGGTASHADFAIFDMKVRQGHAAQLEIADVKTQTSANRD